MEDGPMIVFKDVHEMRRWVVQKIGNGWSGNGPAVAEIINKIPNRPPYKTDWTEFLNSLPQDLDQLYYEQMHLAKPKKEYVALVEIENKKNQVLGIMSERDKNDCFIKVYETFPQLVKNQSIVKIKTKSELTAGEKKQLTLLDK